MRFLPIVDRELRVRARQGTTYWGRCAAATVATIVAMEAMASYAKAASPAALGALTFVVIRWAADRLQAELKATAPWPSASGSKKMGG